MTLNVYVIRAASHSIFHVASSVACFSSVHSA